MLLKTALVAAYAQCCVGVTVIPGGVPKPYTGGVGVSSADELFKLSAGSEFVNTSAQVLMSSYDQNEFSENDGIHASGDSFIRGAIQAWGEHLHLVIRPEEVWFTILVQMNFYMNAHAEDIRSMFVDHEGQEVIYVEDLTWYDVLRRFKDEIQARVKTDWLLDWIMPSFTTSTENDVMTANILMMGLTKAFFKFEGGIICGLPSVTLLGEQADWEALLAKLDRLPEFGSEPEAFKARLKPILTRFVSSYADPDSDDTKSFWNQIVSTREGHICGGPPYYVSGWITGFYFWDEKGEPFARNEADLTLDDITYPSLDLTHNVPVGYARVPFIMRDFNNTERYEAYVLAGTLGKQVTTGAPEGYQSALERVGAGGDGEIYDAAAHGTLKPLSSWMLYGPVDHNATDREWQAETELSDLTAAIRSNYNSSQCSV
jgi:hypothetical protein